MTRISLVARKALLPVAWLAAAMLLSSCGGGSGGSAGSGYTVRGVAAVGAPIASAKVQVLCNDGVLGGSTTTDGQGNFEAQVPARCASPWLLEAFGGTGPAKPIYSYVLLRSDSEEKLVRVNITPLTQLMTDVVFEAYIPGRLRPGIVAGVGDGTFDPAKAPDTQRLLEVLRGLQPPGADPVTYGMIMRELFQPRPGDTMDDLLEAFGQQRGTVATEALVEQSEARGGNLASGQPWKTLFGERATLTVSGTNCTAMGHPVGPASAMLRMQDRDLEVTIATSLAPTPVTFKVGPGGSSDFQFILKGDSPFVRLSAYAGGNLLSLFTDAGAAKATFSTGGGGGVTCTLDTPLRRADLTAFHPAARIRSAIPAAGVRGACPASGGEAAYAYEVSSLGDVRFRGASLTAEWLDASHAYYSESLQYGMGGPGPSYQVQLAPLPSGQGIQAYYFGGAPGGVNCTSYNP